MSCPYYLHNINFCLTLRRYNAFGEDAANLFDGRIFKKVFDFEGVLYLLSLFEYQDGIALQVEPEPQNQAVWKEADKIAQHAIFDTQSRVYHRSFESDRFRRSES
jgi:hypothetical protein